MGINNPVPRDLGKESQKAAKILASFVKPNQLINYDSVIPPHVLRNAKGLMIITVLKAGFLFSGRAGSGVIVARLPDGSWSPPSAVMTGGAGVGGQIGAELTDFIFILNTRDAVETFARGGSMTLGGNVSLAAGPIGRSGEAAGGLSASNTTAVFSYAKTKGLFAGVSLEGSVIVERREANRKFYGNNCTSRSILSGRVKPPRSVAPLFKVLDSKAFRSDWDDDDYGDSLYDDIPDFDTDYDGQSRYSRDDEFDDVYAPPRQRDSRRGYTDDYERRGSVRTSGSGRPSGRYRDDYDDDDDEDAYDYRDRSRDRYSRDRDRDEYSGAVTRYGSSSGRDRYGDRYDDRDRDRDRYGSRDRFDRDDRYDDRRSNSVRSRGGDSYGRSRDSRDSSRANSRSAGTDATAGSEKGIRARALYTFRGEQSGDLSFQKGDIIHIVEKSNSSDDWWTGELGGQQGIFPANYVNVL